MRKVLSIIFLLIMGGVALASAPSRPNTYVSGTVIDPVAVTQNETTLYSYVQSGVDTYKAGSITQAAISSTAGILYSQLNLSGGILPSDINTSATTNIYQFGSLNVPNTFTLNNTVQGAILYDNGTSIVKLSPGTAGQFLETQGPSANPVFANTGLSPVSTATPAGVSSFTISSLSPGIRYKLILNLQQATSTANWTMQFNSDSANHQGQTSSFDGSGGTLTFHGIDGNTANISLTSGALSTTSKGQFEILFETTPGSNNNVIVSGIGTYFHNADGVYANAFVTGLYSGGSSLSTLTIATTAGTFTGTATLYQMN